MEEGVDEGAGDFGAAQGGGFDGVGVVSGGGAEEAEVEDGQVELEGDAEDGVVEEHEGSGGEALVGGVGEIAVVDGAEGEGEPGLEAGGDGAAVVGFKVLGDFGELGEGAGRGGEGLEEKIGVHDGVVAADAEDEVGGIGGEMRGLIGDFERGGAVNGEERGAPAGGEERLDLGDDVGAAAGVSGVI